MSDESIELSAQNIHVWRGERHLLQGIDLELHSGTLLHVRGHNGAGKTTLLRILAGLSQPEAGEVRWRNRLLSDARDDYHAQLAYAAHEPALKADLTALENLRYAVGLKRHVSDLELRGALETTGVGECAHLLIRVLSAGQRRRVVMARVFAVQAQVWLLDEPTSNLDTSGAELIGRLLGEHLQRGGSAIVVSHHELIVGKRIERLDLAA